MHTTEAALTRDKPPSVCLSQSTASSIYTSFNLFLYQQNGGRQQILTFSALVVAATAGHVYLAKQRINYQLCCLTNRVGNVPALPTNHVNVSNPPSSAQRVNKAQRCRRGLPPGCSREGAARRINSVIKWEELHRGTVQQGQQAGGPHVHTHIYIYKHTQK